MTTRVPRIAAEIAAAALGLAFLLVVFRADQAWFKRHVLPDFFAPRSEQLAIFMAVRIAVAAAALALIVWGRPALGRLVERKGWRRIVLDLVPIALAVAAALVVSELVLEQAPWRARHQAPVGREPVRRWDDRLGWVHVPNRTGRGVIGGREVSYSFDAAGHRVRSPAEPVDYAEPTMLFLGESIMVGNGLTYDETIPARTAALTGCAAANLAVGGYATDQMYLRFIDEAPRFRRPVAVVVLFMPGLFQRSLDADRPHLDRGLVWRPQEKGLRLVEVARRLFPVHSTREIAEAEARVREQLAAIVSQARARGAAPLVLVPQLDPDGAEDQAMRRRILDAARVPYLRVTVDPSWRLKNNRHPNAQADAVIAAAVAQYLQAHRLPRCSEPR